MTEMDLSFLAEAEVQPTQMAKLSRGRTEEFNPMEAHYLKSFNGARTEKFYRAKDGTTKKTWYGEAFQIKVKSQQAHHVERLLRNAANRNNGGCSVQFFLSADSDERITIDMLPGTKNRKGYEDVQKIANNRNVWVAFQAKERIERPRDVEDNGDDDEAYVEEADNTVA